MRLAGALEAALDSEFVPFEGLFWSARSPCMALEKLAGICGYREAFASSGVIRQLLAVVGRSSFTCVDDNWDDLHAAQRCAARALWWLAYGDDPSADVCSCIERCFERTRHGGGGGGAARRGAPVLECLLVCGLDTLFLADTDKVPPPPPPPAHKGNTDTHHYTPANFSSKKLYSRIHCLPPPPIPSSPNTGPSRQRQVFHVLCCSSSFYDVRTWLRRSLQRWQRLCGSPKACTVRSSRSIRELMKAKL
jgi:hypothetical protein